MGLLVVGIFGELFCTCSVDDLAEVGFLLLGVGGGGLSLSCAVGWYLVGTVLETFLGLVSLIGNPGVLSFPPFGGLVRLEMVGRGQRGEKRAIGKDNKRSPLNGVIRVIWATVCLRYVCRGGNIDYVGDYLGGCRHE